MIQLIKIMATPYLFLTILISIQNADVSWKLGRRVVCVAFFNAFLALAVGLLFSNLFRPGDSLQGFSGNLNLGGAPEVLEHSAFTLNTFIQQFAPQSIFEPFLKNNVLVIAVYALVFGLILKKVRIEKFGLSQLEENSSLKLLLKVFEKGLNWIVHLIPIAVFAVVGSAVHQYGITPAYGLIIYLVVVLGGLLFHAILVYGYWITQYAKISVREFINATKGTLTYAFSVNSSLASLPYALQSLAKLKISPTAAAIGTGVATNLNNGGIILYEAMGVLVLAQAHGIHLTIAQQFTTCLIALVAGMGIGGIPEAGFISLSIVATAVGVPTDMLPLLLTVDWIIGRTRSLVNVTSDMTVSIVLNEMEKRDLASK